MCVELLWPVASWRVYRELSGLCACRLDRISGAQVESERGGADVRKLVAGRVCVEGERRASGAYGYRASTVVNVSSCW
jgi:hypothetical protein